ncbi:PLD nuclease N-terminal domain-containing protein [Clostridium swellfunianum]|uniref:PLD nuclease N-terminal domain-containing protein n=1 Tax=Clostridium swellfunianum TaxID=1367462 RepID=UPI00202ECFB2|nr:PLD nuclease N-terminal domain-containing protein [Clostridium swellfunianum]MCM0648330.1 PLD nuclease N-terminal domain-containing protein [Clostridium swellfunianum]
MFADMTTAEIIKLLLPFLMLQLGLIVFCLYRLVKDQVKYLPKWAWALIIVFINFFGAIIYLFMGRERD